MKRFLVLTTLIILSFICMPDSVNYICAEPTLYLSIEKLMAYPQVALDEKNQNSDNNDLGHLTPTEFTNMLNSLYENDYVLVNSSSQQVPTGKKPLVLIFNNLVYASSPQANGFVDKLLVDRKGNIATYTSKRSINERLSYDNECIPLLESFVATHPLFSNNGAKATIAISNDNGIFGYKTSKSNATSKFDIKHAIRLADKLKQLGYVFACGGFEKSESLSDLNFASELNTWNNFTSNICKQTNTYITSQQLNEYKLSLLKDNGFDNILTYDDAGGVIKKINGQTLREDVSLLDIFDSSKVYDNANRKKPYFAW